MKIAVIGAGAAGLAALHQCISGTYDDQVICYEKTDQIGGTWVYREETGSDRYGLPIHTSMYKSLRTNLPKEVMGYPDFPISERPESYLSRTEILDFLNAYCDHFKLRPYIRLLHHVELVEPAVGDRKWSVKVRDLQRDAIVTEAFDAIMVCNGHYFEPRIPKISGHDVFTGKQMHSHDYRVPEIFNGKTVVVLGAGPSGYKYSFPFLAESCGVRTDSNMVTPLWKHLVSIENPTLALVGLPFYVCAFSMFDLQVRFVLRHWHGERQFPARADMLRSEAEEAAKRAERGLQKRHFHMMGPKQGHYYDDLASIAGVVPLPSVLTKLHNESSMRFLDDLVHYRQDRYKILDDYNFVQL
ncbi:hypothetical protein ACFW04_008689 [Cataglyphis niger]